MLHVTHLLCGARPTRATAFAGWTGEGSADRRHVVWQLTRRCSLRCPDCGMGSSLVNDPGEVRLEEMMAVIDDLCASGVESVALAGGDPMLHPHFYDVAGYACARSLRVEVATTGSRIDSHAAERLRDLGIACVGVSFASRTAESEQIRGRAAAVQRARSAIRHCRGAGLAAGLRLRLTRRNLQNLPEALEWIEEEEIPLVALVHVGGKTRERPTDTDLRRGLHMVDDAVRRWDHDGHSRETLTLGQRADGAFFWMLARRRDAKRADSMWRQLQRQRAPRRGELMIDDCGNILEKFSAGAIRHGNVREQRLRSVLTKWEKRGAESGADFARGCKDCRFIEICGGTVVPSALTEKVKPCYLRDYESRDC